MTDPIDALRAKRNEIDRQIKQLVDAEEARIQSEARTSAIRVACKRCDGKGDCGTYRGPCPDCDGFGWVPALPWKGRQRHGVHYLLRTSEMPRELEGGR